MKAAKSSEDDVVARKPTKQFEAAFSNGFISPDVFVGIVYRTL
jgi:hypothetical protein